MFSALERLLGHSGGTPGMGGALLRSAEIIAWMRRDTEADVEHLLHVLVGMVDVEKALEARSLYPEDVLAVISQLLDDRPKSEPEEDPAHDVQPPRSARLAAVAQASVRSGVMSSARLVEALAAALPRELAFVRAPLSAIAPKLGELFDARLSSRDRTLTFTAWDPELRTCMALMQQQSDKRRWENWQLGPIHLFFTLLSYKPYFAFFRSHGHAPIEVMKEVARTVPRPPGLRPRPPSLVPSISPALFALFQRAERYAAEDGTEVRLRHALAALHDEKLIAPWIDRLVE